MEQRSSNPCAHEWLRGSCVKCSASMESPTAKHGRDDSLPAVLRRRYKALREDGYNHEFCNVFKRAADAIEGLSPEPAAAPVAWRKPSVVGGYLFWNDSKRPPEEGWTPLYLRPQPPKAIHWEDIAAVIRSHKLPLSGIKLVELIDDLYLLCKRGPETKPAAPQQCGCDAPYREGYECMQQFNSPGVQCERLAAETRAARESCRRCTGFTDDHVAGCPLDTSDPICPNCKQPAFVIYTCEGITRCSGCAESERASND